MARGKQSAQQRTVKLKRSRFLEAVREAARIREQAKTYTGRHGAFVKDFTESTNYSKEAFAVIAKMNRMGDDLKRQFFMDEIIMGFEMMGWNDQGNLFARVDKVLRDRVDMDGDADGGPGDDADEDDDEAPPPGAQGARPLKQDGIPLELAAKVLAGEADAPAPKAHGPRGRRKGPPLTVVKQPASPARDAPFGEKLN
jgi:hypothetical protein